jgi:hypothetical protein
MGWDYHAYDVTVEMVGFELEQWGRQTWQDKSKGYLEEGFSFMRNSNTNIAILPAETKLKDLDEGHRITLKVTIAWVDKDRTQAEWLHREHRDQSANTAVNESEELKKIARHNIATPLESNIGTDLRCRTCGEAVHPQAACCNCGDSLCHDCHCRINYNAGDASCYRCLPTVIKVVLNHFEKNNIVEWVARDDDDPAADQQ